MRVTQLFVREQEKKGSVRYKPMPTVEEPIASVIYINRPVLAKLAHPTKLLITLETADAHAKEDKN